MQIINSLFKKAVTVIYAYILHDSVSQYLHASHSYIYMHAIWTGIDCNGFSYSVFFALIPVYMSVERIMWLGEVGRQ
jgi:hypothetical protein